MKTKNHPPGKKISVFYFLILLVITSVILVVYINNVIAVNQLSVGNNNLKEEIKKVVQNNDLLRADAEQLSSFERIKTVAFEKYNLSYRESSINDNNNIILKKSQLK